MNIFQAIVLGTIQGLAEWLPISSEAMVTLAGRFLFNFEFKDALGNAIWLHFGTFFAALFYFRKDILNLPKDKDLLKFIIISSFITAIIAIPLMFLAFTTPMSDGLMSILIGLFLIIIAFLNRRQKSGNKTIIETNDAIITGAAQGLAALPGFSRSGLTISTLLFRKFSLSQAFRLSFLMSLPVILGAQILLPFLKTGFEITFPLIIGGVTSAIVGIVSIGFLMKTSKKLNFFKATLGLGIATIILGFSII